MDKEKQRIFEKISLFALTRKNALYRAASVHGLYPGQLPVLEYILANEGCTQNDIAQKLGVSPASIALSTRRLQKAGLIRKKTDESNLRRNMLFITKTGQEAVEKCRSEVDLFRENLLKDFTQIELENLSQCLDHMNENILSSADIQVDFSSSACTPPHCK